MHENEIFSHENKISMHEHENFAPGFRMGSWAVHNFMNAIFPQENIWTKLSFSGMKFHFHA